MCMVFLLRLHFYHLTMRNVLAVHYAQINTHLKMPTYPSHSGYYSPAIKFIIFSLPKFHFVRSVLFEKAKGIRKVQIMNIFTLVSRFFCHVQVTLR